MTQTVSVDGVDLKVNPQRAEVAKKNFSKWFLPRYILSIKFRVVYWSLMLFISLATLTIGACMQGFCASLYTTAAGAEFFVAFGAVPVTFILLAILSDQVIQVLYDQFESEPFPFLRANFVAAGVPAPMANAGILVLLELLPLLYVLKNVWTVSELFQSYCHGGMVAISILAGLLPILKGIVALKGTRSIVNVRFDELKIASILICPRRSDCSQWCQKAVEDPEQQQQQQPQQQQPDEGEVRILTKMQSAILWLVVCSIIYCLCLAAYYANFGIWASLVFLLLLLWASYYGIENLAPRLLGDTYLVMLTLYAILSAGTLALSMGSIQTGTQDRDLLVESWRPVNATIPPSASSGYPFCGLRWGNETLGDSTQLSVFDFAVMSDFVYGPVGAGERMLRRGMNDTILGDYVLEQLQNETALARWAIIKFPTAKKRVMAIRGTQNFDEILADVDFFAPSAILDFMSYFFPISSLLPKGVVRWYFKAINLKSWFGGRSLFEDHLNEAQRQKELSEQEGLEFFITGHSLGGLISSILGSRLNVPAITFEPPGVDLMLDRLGIEKEDDLFASLTAVMPKGGVVGRIDGQLGLSLPYTCPGKPEECHRVSWMVCELYDKCGGDPRGRRPSDHITKWDCSYLQKKKSA